MKLRDMFDDICIYNQELSIDEKIKIIGLSNKRVQELKNMQVKKLEYNSNGNYLNNLEIIDTDRIVGLARPFWGDNWIDVLDNKYCHKVRNFMKYNREDFDKILLLNNMDDYPSVVEYDGEYYISGNGLHRLTIAKCLGNKKARAIVQKEIK